MLPDNMCGEVSQKKREKRGIGKEERDDCSHHPPHIG
jgi:hypothetical protein